MASANTENPEQIIAQRFSDEDEINETTIFLSPSNTSASVLASDTSNIMTSGEHNKRHKKEKHAPEALSTFNQHMTTAAHACIILFVILIVYFCFSGSFEFFTWHPLLLSIGWMFLMTEAVLTISKDNLITGTLPKKLRVKLHWIFLTIAIILVWAGFIVIFINKNNKNKEHFKTWHALFGFVGILCSLPTALDGILALYHGDLRQYISPRFNKFIHITSGVTTLVFGGIALVLSVYSKWFARNSDNNIVTFVLGLALVAYPVVWALTKPTMTCLKQVQKLLKTE